VSHATTVQEETLASIERIYAKQQKRRATVASTTAAQRIGKLRRLHRALFARRDELKTAMWEDFRKPAAEVDLAEVYAVAGEARHAIRHLRSWMRPRRVSTRLALLGSSSSVVYEPKGVVLIVAPWNFPVNLCLSPLVSAIAAGNCAILKPSELTPATTAFMKRFIADLFDEDEVAVVEGGVEVAQALLRHRFDHIFFTGSPEVGRVYMRAAAEFLTPVTLELGGKSPAIVERTADLGAAARRIAWGKFFNAGQVCIAPDYVLVDDAVREEFLTLLRSAIEALGDESTRPILVNDAHAARIARLLDGARGAGARVVTGGRLDGRRFEPTVLTDVPVDTALMREEIFGPILPVVGFRTLDEAFEHIGAGEKPLTLYAFTRDRRAARRIVQGTRAGGTVFNHTLVQFYELDLPFGGVGTSGLGKSHGFAGFEAFSNARGVLHQRLPVSAIELLYPPYGGRIKQFLIDFTVRWL
jgi:aldehyde dehydrogenase (NAD+)